MEVYQKNSETFSSDIDTKFRLEKCAVIHAIKRKTIASQSVNEIVQLYHGKTGTNT